MKQRGRQNNNKKVSRCWGFSSVVEALGSVPSSAPDLASVPAFLLQMPYSLPGQLSDASFPSYSYISTIQVQFV